MKSIAILPVYNEVAQIGSLLARFKRVAVDALVIDDGSTDGSSDVIQKDGFSCIRHVQREGIGKCLQDGISYAIKNQYDTVVIMAGNGKDDPVEIPQLLAALDEGYDYIQGSRFLKGGHWENLPRKRWWAIKLFTWLWSLCTFHYLTDVTNGFRAYRLSILNHPDVRWQQDWLKTYEFEYYLHFKVLRLKHVRFKEIPVSKNYPSRTNYSKIRPGMDWVNIVRPLFLLLFGIKN